LKRFVVIIVAFALLISIGVPVSAKRAVETIEVIYRNIVIEIDGKAISPRDVTGAVVYPFIRNGTTYLPVRAVGEALGMSVDWDGENDTVKLDTVAAAGKLEVTGEASLFKTGTELIEVIYRDIKIVINGESMIPRDVTGVIVEPFIYNGTTFLPIRAVGEALGLTVSWDGEKNIVSLTSPNAVPPKKIAYYEDFPEVPDYGAYSGAKLLGVLEVSSTEASYYIYSMDNHAEIIEEYNQLLADSGFEYYSSWSWNMEELGKVDYDLYNGEEWSLITAVMTDPTMEYGVEKVFGIMIFPASAMGN
jgi:hypothetical protein